MAKNWITVRVELLGGRDIICDPPPGRIMLVGPRHTFADLAVAIDAAFARWDLAHLHMFTLGDGRLVGEPDPNWNVDILDEESLKVAETVALGELFTYVFDLGDEWRWGSIPDQYGRRWEDDSREDQV